MKLNIVLFTVVFNKLENDKFGQEYSEAVESLFEYLHTLDTSFRDIGYNLPYELDVFIDDVESILEDKVILLDQTDIFYVVCSISGGVRILPKCKSISLI